MNRYDYAHIGQCFRSMIQDTLYMNYEIFKFLSKSQGGEAE